MVKPQKPQSSSRRAAREKRRQEQRRQRIIVLGSIAAVALILVGIAIYYSVREQQEAVKNIVVNPSLERPMVDGNAAGDPAAPVKVELYSDFQCPGCLSFYKNIEPRLISDYVATGKVYFVYHTTGLWVGPESLSSAEAAYCAREQGKFWEYHDILYDNWNGENQGAFSDPRLLAFAEKIGLDVNQFKTCYNNHQYRDTANKDRDTALSLGINATPTLLINGKIFQGGLSYDNLAKEIESALATSSE